MFAGGPSGSLDSRSPLATAVQQIISDRWSQRFDLNLAPTLRREYGTT